MLLCACAVAAGGCGSPEGAVATATIAVTTEAPIATATTATEATATTTTTAATETAQLYPVRVDGKWGFIDNTGAIKIEPAFAGIRRLDGAGELIGFREGLCAVQLLKDGPWGYIDMSGRMVIEPQFDGALWFSGGLTTVRMAGEYYFIDKTGATVLGPFRGNSVPDVEVEELGGVRLQVYHDTFSEGLAVAYTVDSVEDHPAGLAGYVDESGTWVIPPQYWDAGSFSEGLARVAVKTEKGAKIGFIDKKGAWLVKDLDDARPFSEGLALVWQNGECGYIDATGAVVIPIPFVIDGFDFSGGVARVGGGFDGSPSYIDKTGTTIWQGE